MATRKPLAAAASSSPRESLRKRIVGGEVFSSAAIAL
jgi:hypothetical protein